MKGFTRNSLLVVMLTAHAARRKQPFKSGKWIHDMKTVRSCDIRRSDAVLLITALAVSVICGCGKPPMRQVTGTVTLNGKLVEHCKVGFFPDVTEFNPDRHGYGFGVTDATGKFTIQHPQGEKGIWSGDYKVTFTLWVDNKGKALPMETKPSEVEGGVKNLFPLAYEEPSTTPESVSVGSGENSFNFSITAPAAGG